MTNLRLQNKSCISKNYVKPWKSKEPKISRMPVKIRYNVESVGAMRMIYIIHWFLHANAKDLLDLSTSTAWRVGFSHRNKKNHQVLRIKMFVPSIGRDSSVKSASKCIHIPSKLVKQFTKLLTLLTKLLHKLKAIISCLNQCPWIRTLREIFTCWPWHQNKPSLN